MANAKRKCPNDGNYNRPADGVLINNRLYCRMDCAVEYGRKNLSRGRKIKEKYERNKKRALRADSLAHQIELTQQEFNRFIRALDQGKSCHSCGENPCGHRMEAGHVLSVAAHPSVRFSPLNCFSQGSRCNGGQKPKRGKNPETVTQEYKRRLAMEYGQEWLDWLDGPHEPAKFTREGLKTMRAVFAAERRRLEQGLPPSKNWRAL